MINSDIINKLNTSSCPNADPNNNYNILHTLIENATNKHIPDKVVKFNKHKYKNLTKGIIKSISFRDKLHYEIKQTTPNTVQHTTLNINLSTYNKILLKKPIRAAKLAYYEACFEKYKHDMRKTWLTINDILNKSRKKKSFPEAFKEDGQIISDKIEIANKFNLYFTNIGLNLAQKIKTPTNQNFCDYLKTKYNNVFKFEEVTTGEIENIIDNLKPKFSYGRDNMSTKLMKSIKAALINPLTIIINQSLKTGIFPDKLKIA